MEIRESGELVRKLELIFVRQYYVLVETDGYSLTHVVHAYTYGTPVHFY